MLLSNLLATSGASSTVLEGVIPYNFKSLCELINDEPEQACSAETARKMAMAAFVRARTLSSTESNFGFAITASLGTNRPKRGATRAHVAIQTLVDTRCYSFLIDRDLSRADQEQSLATIGLEKLLLALGLTSTNKHKAEEERQSADTDVQRLITDPGSVIGEPGTAFLCGAFNPLHEGHRKMKEIGEAILGQLVQYELCIHNVDKAPLDYIEIAKRRERFEEYELVLTGHPKFIDKARILAPSGGAKFLVGADTMKRIVNPSYYENAAACEAALAEFVRREDEFIVFGREFSGEFQTLHELPLQESFKKICREIPEEQFRIDVSSTQLRNPESTN